MNKTLSSVAGLALVVPGLQSPAQTTSRVPFDANWKFARFGKMPDGSFLREPGAAEPSPEQSAYPDAGWRDVALPHDWAIEEIGRASCRERV